MAVEIDAKYMNRKRGMQKAVFVCFRLLSYFIALVLFYILGFIIVKGISVINWDFLTQAPADGMTKGGIWPAIVGTFCLMIGSAVFSFPVGVMSGIYMNEYAPKGRLVNFIRTMFPDLCKDLDNSTLKNLRVTSTSDKIHIDLPGKDGVSFHIPQSIK